MANHSSSTRSFSKHGVRINIILKHDVAQKFFHEIPSGRRSSWTSDWIAQGLKYLKHKKAVERIRQLREEGAAIPVSDKRDSTAILREFRYTR